MEGKVRPQRRRRTIAAAIGASLLLVLFIAGLAFTNSVGAARVAENAAALHWANAATGTAALTRAALVQAITFTELEVAGLVTGDEVAFTMDQVTASHDELVHLEKSGDHSPSLTHLVNFIGGVEKVISALEEGDMPRSGERLNEMETTYVALVDALSTEQDAIQAEIVANSAASSRVNGYLVFFLTLAIPASAVAVYWWIARRQVREYQLKTDLEIEAERALGRAKDAFIAGLSHELRTPLTSIYGFAEVLTDTEEPDPDQTKDLAQIIANEAAEMTRMVDDLLTASRLESTGIEIEMSPTKLNEVIESAITPFERAGLSIKRSPTSAMAQTDGARLRHVLVNLISNAARHGGAAIGIEVSPGDETIDIEVWDNGPGVPEDQLERLFDRFVHNGATPLLTGSVGLGLAIASRLTTMLDGRIAYQRFGSKTFFIVRIPAYVIDLDEDDEESVADVIRALST